MHDRDGKEALSDQGRRTQAEVPRGTSQLQILSFESEKICILGGRVRLRPRVISAGRSLLQSKRTRGQDVSSCLYCHESPAPGIVHPQQWTGKVRSPAPGIVHPQQWTSHRDTTADKEGPGASENAPAEQWTTRLRPRVRKRNIDVRKLTVDVTGTLQPKGGGCNSACCLSLNGAHPLATPEQSNTSPLWFLWDLMEVA